MTLAVSSFEQTGSRSRYCRAQAHPGPHLHCGPQAHMAFGTAFCSVRLWQPQRQVWPGQLVQVQGAWVGTFMAFLLWLKVMPV